MPTAIFRDDVQRLMAGGAQLIDVLPPEEYGDQHLSGTISIPLKTLDEGTTANLRKDRPVIVYCYDYQLRLSVRHESASRVAARESWLCRGLRLCTG